MYYTFKNFSTIECLLNNLNQFYEPYFCFLIIYLAFYKSQEMRFFYILICITCILLYYFCVNLINGFPFKIHIRVLYFLIRVIQYSGYEMWLTLFYTLREKVLLSSCDLSVQKYLHILTFSVALSSEIVVIARSHLGQFSSLQYVVSPTGHRSVYCLGSRLCNINDRTRTSVSTCYGRRNLKKNFFIYL